MIFKNRSDNLHIVIATCNCGCNSEIHITKYDRDEFGQPLEYSLSLHSSKFDEEQLSIFSVLLRRIKRAWCSLVGKDYLYMDVIFNEEEFKEFVDNLNNIK